MAIHCCRLAWRRVGVVEGEVAGAAAPSMQAAARLEEAEEGVQMPVQLAEIEADAGEDEAVEGEEGPFGSRTCTSKPLTMVHKIPQLRTRRSAVRVCCYAVARC